MTEMERSFANRHDVFVVLLADEEGILCWVLSTDNGRNTHTLMPLMSYEV